MKRLFILLALMSSSVFAMDAQKTEAAANIIAPMILQQTPLLSGGSFTAKLLATAMVAKMGLAAKAGVVASGCTTGGIVIASPVLVPSLSTIILGASVAYGAYSGGKYLYDRYTSPASEQQ